MGLYRCVFNWRRSNEEFQWNIQCRPLYGIQSMDCATTHIHTDTLPTSHNCHLIHARAHARNDVHYLSLCPSIYRCVCVYLSPAYKFISVNWNIFGWLCANSIKLLADNRKLVFYCGKYTAFNWMTLFLNWWQSTYMSSTLNSVIKSISNGYWYS